MSVAVLVLNGDHSPPLQHSFHRPLPAIVKFFHLGGFHLLWALLVVSGAAQPVMDFIFWLHFIRPVYVIEGFEPLRAAGLILLTTAVGYAIGGAFALLWNHIHRSQR